MDTIAINANEALDDELKNKKQKNINSAKAAAVAGAAGIAVGGIATSMVDNGDGEIEIEESPLSVTGQHEDVAVVESLEQDAVVEVNPDDVMLNETVQETVAMGGSHTQTEHMDIYQPFANNDPIYGSGNTMTETQPEDVLIAQASAVAHEESEIIGDDSLVDAICGEPQIDSDEEPEILVGPVTENELIASSDELSETDMLSALNIDSEETNIDIQSDLMV